jgi:lipopolysaccharide/colanic/teichoic acid biosynthesis glycosyltransferase
MDAVMADDVLARRAPRAVLKRAFDIVFASLALALTLPLMCVAGIAIAASPEARVLAKPGQYTFQRQEEHRQAAAQRDASGDARRRRE